MIKWKFSGLILCAALSSMVLGGCIIANSNRSFTGTSISNQTLKRVKLGKTTRQWLLSVLGEPTSATESPDGVEILKYDGVTESRDSISVTFFFPLVNVTETKKISEAHYFEIKDGIVQAHWKDSTKLQKSSNVH